MMMVTETMSAASSAAVNERGFQPYQDNGGTDRCAIVTSGQQSELVTLHKVLKMRVIRYTQDHRVEPSVTAVAQLLSSILYGKRFFPYYTFNLLVGIDENNVGKVYNYDAIGSVDSVNYSCQGTGKLLMHSVLDNRLLQQNQAIKSAPLTKEGTINLAKDVITSAAERDIYTGDGAEVVVIDASGFDMTRFELRKD